MIMFVLFNAMSAIVNFQRSSFVSGTTLSASCPHALCIPDPNASLRSLHSVACALAHQDSNTYSTTRVVDAPRDVTSGLFESDIVQICQVCLS